MSKGDRDFNTKLVEAVEGHECLYDYKLKDYSNREKVQLAWENVAKEVEQTAKEYKESWRNLRIVYTRALKKPPSGSGTKKRPWYLLENMNFLKPYVNINLAKSLPGNLPSPPHTEDSEVFGEQISEFNDSVINNDIQNNTNDDGNTSGNGANIINEQFSKNPMGPPKKKKKTQADADEFIINYIRSKSNHRPNEDGPKKLFLLSLLPDLEEMSTAQFRMFRHEVVNLIDRILRGQPSLTSYNLTTNHQTTSQQQFDSSSYDSQSHTSENTTDFDQPNMLYQELQPFLLRKPEK